MRSSRRSAVYHAAAATCGRPDFAFEIRRPLPLINFCIAPPKRDVAVNDPFRGALAPHTCQFIDERPAGTAPPHPTVAESIHQLNKISRKCKDILPQTCCVIGAFLCQMFGKRKGGNRCCLPVHAWCIGRGADQLPASQSPTPLGRLAENVLLAGGTPRVGGEVFLIGLGAGLTGVLVVLTATGAGAGAPTGAAGAGGKVLPSWSLKIFTSSESTEPS